MNYYFILVKSQFQYFNILPITFVFSVLES